jgi:hypothetical protein
VQILITGEPIRNWRFKETKRGVAARTKINEPDLRVSRRLESISAVTAKDLARILITGELIRNWRFEVRGWRFEKSKRGVAARTKINDPDLSVSRRLESISAVTAKDLARILITGGPIRIPEGGCRRREAGGGAVMVGYAQYLFASLTSPPSAAADTHGRQYE